MSSQSKALTIWTNAKFPSDVRQRLLEGIGPQRLIEATEMSSLNLSTSPADPLLAEADIAFGQPLAEQVMNLPRLRWTHLTTAGYTNYDRADLRAVLKEKGGMLTTSSAVYADPCAQHVLAMMLSFARQLPQSMKVQLSSHGARVLPPVPQTPGMADHWPAAERRRNSFLLSGQTVVICGFGEIGRRLSELLSPFHMKIIAVRRALSGDEPITTVTHAQLAEVLPTADHVVNLLPANEGTNGFFNAATFARMKPGCYFYNIGRGSTVDQESLIFALQSGRIAAAYLDVTTPEPLPLSHQLWSLPNCYITPHTAGGQRNEMADLVEHFLNNLHRYTNQQPLINRVI